jgi:hypothetical protein
MKPAHYILGISPVGLSDDKTAIVQMETEEYPKVYSPLEEHTGLFLTFAHCEDPLDFASRYGMLYGGINPESLELWQHEIASMKEATDSWLGGEDMFPVMATVEEHLNVEAVFRRDKEELVLMPANLSAAMWLQFALAIHHRYEYRQCTWCGTHFHAKGKQVKAERVFCSQACKAHDYRARRAQELDKKLKQETEAIIKELKEKRLEELSKLTPEERAAYKEKFKKVTGEDLEKVLGNAKKKSK